MGIVALLLQRKVSVNNRFVFDLALEYRANFYLELLNQYRQLTDEQIKADVRRWISQWPVVGHSDDKTIVALFRQSSLHKTYSASP